MNAILQPDAADVRDFLPRLDESIRRTARWVEEHRYEAYDPGDGDLSPLRHFTLNAQILKQILTASVLRIPFHIRPWIGIKPHRSTKGTGYMAWGHVKMYALTGEQHFRGEAESCLAWLMENRSPGFDGYCWGNAFDFTTRAGTIPRYTPTIVWTSLIGLAFLEAYETLGGRVWLDVASSAAEWIKTLPREETGTGVCLSYVPFKQSSIHNSNMLGASLLARVAAHTGDDAAVRLAKEAMRYSCERQNPDGSWFYGEAPKYHWIDNFHTGYNLDSLKRHVTSTGDLEFESNITRGMAYFKEHFFLEDGRPKYYHNRLYPIDIQCAAQSIDTLAFLSSGDEASLQLAARVAAWTISHMQSKEGAFYYRDLGWKIVETPMLHWGQGTMYKALAHLFAKLRLGMAH